MKWLKKLCKTEIDERQQADLNRVTATGYWIAFYLLLLAIVVEGPILRKPFVEWAVEWGVFMILAIYEVIVCVRIGVWAPNVKQPTMKSCVIWSLTGGFLFSAVVNVTNYCRWEEQQRTAWNFILSFLVIFIWMSMAIFIAYLITLAIFMRRQKKVDDAMKQEDMEDENRE